MSTPDDPTTVLEFLQGSALAPVLGLELPEPVENSAIPDFLIAPPTPELPQGAADLIMQGISLPSLPGVDQLFTPLIQLAQSLGSGVFSGVDPVNVHSSASALIDKAAGLSTQGLSSVSQTWSGAGNQAATQINEVAQRSGSELSDRGNAISQTTAAAAESVQRGNAQLATIAQSFASAVVAAAPIALTPPGQAMLLAAAAEHMQAAMAAVNATRSEMLAHTATMNSLAGSIPVPAPPVSDALAAAGPLAQQASQLLEGATAGATQLQSATGGSAAGATPSGPAQTSAAHAAAALNSGVDKLWGTGNPFAASGAGVSHQLGSAGGAIGPAATTRAGSGTFGASSGGGGIVGPSGIAALQPLSSTSQSPTPFAPSGTAGGAVTGTSPGGAMMGGGAGAMGGARGQQDSSRTTPGYLIEVSDNNAVIGDLPMVTPAVIGSEDPDQALFTGL